MKNNKIISFDIYDTLIERIVPVEKIHKLLAIKYNSKEFLSIRKIAEEKAKEDKKYGYTIYDIYENINLEKKEQILADEIKYEIENSIPNPIGKELYNKYRSDYLIVCISDMYFPEDIMKKMLDKNGYRGIEKVYVSCEYAESKRNKKLYHIVKREFKGKKIIHIGDSIRSDFINALLSGFKSKLIGKNNKNNYGKKLSQEEYLKYIGYHIFGPMVYEFCLWINKIKQGRKLLFLSREGELLKQCYNLLFESNEEVIYVSRKSVSSGIIYETIKNNRLEELIKIIKKKRPETIKELFLRLRLNGIDKIVDKNELNQIADEKNIASAIKMVYSKKEEILKETKHYNEMFKEYLCDKIDTNIALVDVGWNGSMQKLLENYYKPKKIEISGLYLGCLNTHNKRGFLFETKGKNSSTILNYSGILETIFMPSYGSVIDYSRENGKIVPNFDNCEFTKQSQETIKNIQKGYLKYIEDRKKIGMISLYDNKEIIDIINKIGNTPSKKDLDYLGNIDFYDNGNIEKMINYKKGLYKSFMNSEWKNGYLKKIFKLPIPYNSFLSLIRRGKTDD